MVSLPAFVHYQESPKPVNKIDWSILTHKVSRLAWACLFLALPVTSFPYFPGGLGGATLVRPLATYPLVVLLLLVTIPHLIQQPIPRTILPFLAFVMIALVSSILAFTSDIESLQGVTIADRFIRATATLGLGMAFYFTVSFLHKHWGDLDFSLRWLYIGFALALLWGTFQVVYLVHFSNRYYRLLNDIQGFLSTRKLFTNRISGPSYEPKWFAEQISFVLQPWLIASVLTKYSVFPYRFKWITVEWILLGWSTVILIFTFSRTGLLLSILMGVLGPLLRIILYRSRKGKQPGLPRRKKRVLLETAIVISSLIIIFVLAGSRSTYVARFWSYWTDANSERDRSYLEYLAVQQRVVYLETAFRTFEAHPILGVGLGNYAFYFEEMLPTEKYHSQEIIRLTTPEEGRDRLITPKNLLARLLAETGIFGTITFFGFVFAIVGCILYLWFSPSPQQKFFAIGGMLSFIVFSVIVFSFDSFALPNMWIFFGFVTAAAHLSDPPPLHEPVVPEEVRLH
jgi:hypothetical protein